MYHTIQFAVDVTVDRQIPPKHRLERLLIHKGTWMRPQFRPHVAGTADGPVEMADLFFEDGSTARGVRFAPFAFAEE